MPRILVTGASVAGPALASRLAGVGWDVTVLERADGLREEGQNVDVRGAGREVLRRMGLDDAVRAANTTEEGTEFVEEDGSVVAAFGIEEGEQDGPTAELEVLRGDLARVIVDAAPEGIDWRFGDHVAALEDDGSAVHVTFAGGDRETFDVVAIAEGQRSSTRDLVFDDVELNHLGAYIAYATIPKEPSDTRTWRWFHATGKRSVSLRPDPKGTTRAMLTFMSDERGHDRTDDPRPLLRERFADVGWAAPRILDALEAGGDDLYFEDLAQVVVPSWHRGRVVLLGDAAHCVTPMGGGGTSLALVDAYVLARELGRHDDPTEAFAAYEAAVRPTVEKAQKLPPGTPRVAHPNTRVGVRLLHGAEKLAATGIVPFSPTSALDELELEPEA